MRKRVSKNEIVCNDLNGKNLLYFQQYARRPIPYELERPQHNLEDMMRFQLNMKNFECPPYGFCQ